MAPGIAEKKNNSLPVWGNEKTMNLNNLILTNILSSHYFKVNLYQLKTYHEVIDEIYYQVSHLEPWEKGSRKTSGQTGMCGGVRGVGAGGIVSTAFCILYKLFTLKLTRKQVVGLINHSDSPYIRALGFMYIRYTQPPVDLWDWYEPYLSDPEELDVKAGTGQIMTIGEMLRHFLSKLEWFSTLFPRIPVPIQKDLERKLSDWRSQPENKELLEASEWAEEPEQPSTNGEWNDDSPVQRSLPTSETKMKEYMEDSRVKLDVADEIARERERQKKERERHANSVPHHSSEYRRDHGRDRDRSRSPRRGNDLRSSRGEDDLKRHRKKHYDREHERSDERGHHKSRDASRLRKEVNEQQQHPRSRNHSHDREYERRHEHSHNHEHSKRHQKHSYSHNRYFY